MSKRQFSILLVITVVVALAVLLMPSRTGRDAMPEHATFLPELGAVVNDIALLRVSARGGEEIVTLERTEHGWVVQEFHNYPADWSVLRPLLADLSQAEVVENKTSNPEYYSRLGVEDPDTEGAANRLIEFPDVDALPAIIVGNRAQGREGNYMRRRDEARSVLIDRTITLPFEASAWLDGEIVDIPDDSVIEMTITHADGESVRISRESTEVTDFSLADIPEGREPRSGWTINQLAGALAGLTLEDVAPVDDVDFSEAVEVTLRTEGELTIDARFAEDSEHRWLRLEAAGGEDAEAINERVTGWAYQIPLYKFDAINKRMEDLLAEQEGAEEDE